MTSSYRKLLCGTGLLLAMTATACSDSSSPSKPAAEKPASSASASAPAPSAGAAKLALPAGAQLLVPESDGKGSGKLPTFRSKGTYTVLLTCEGGGKVHLSPNGGEGDETPCDGVPWIYRVFKPEGEQRIALTVSDSSSWSAAVLAGTPRLG